jgi:large subunit ribosomal protein L29e
MPRGRAAVRIGCGAAWVIRDCFTQYSQLFVLHGICSLGYHVDNGRKATFFSSHKSASLLPLQSKNHTNRNQSFKAHRNGIKKPKNHVSKSLKGVGLSLLLPVFSKV